MSLSIIQIISIVGFLLSTYMLYVHYKVEKSASYHSVCDINNRVSCTATVKSGWGSILWLPNGVYGVAFYGLVFGLAHMGYFEYTFYLAIASIVASIGLAYILYRKVKQACVICLGIYVVNIALLIATYMAWGV